MYSQLECSLLTFGHPRRWPHASVCLSASLHAATHSSSKPWHGTAHYPTAGFDPAPSVCCQQQPDPHRRGKWAI